MPIRSLDEAALKIARRFSAGRTEAGRTKSRKGPQNRFFRPFGTLVSSDALLPALKCRAIFTMIFPSVVNRPDRYAKNCSTIFDRIPKTQAHRATLPKIWTSPYPAQRS